MTASTTSHDATASALRAADAAFAALTCPPDPLTLDCTTLTARLGRDVGLPDGAVPLCELRDWMLTHRRAFAARDAIWRDLVARARTGEAGWVIAAVGMAMPALVRLAGGLARGYRGDPADLDAEVLTGFLAALRGAVDLDRPGVYARLCWAGYRAGLAARHADARQVPLTELDRGAASAAPRLPYGHPDLLLAEAVAIRLIDPDEADLISRTRLDHVPVERVAADVGVEPSVLRMRRRRAERRVVRGLTTGLLSGVVSPATRRALAVEADRRAAGRSGEPASP